VPTVEYAKVFNLGNYENERIFFSDEVQPGETPGEAFERVKGWVLAKHDETKEVLSAEKQLLKVNRQINDAEYRLREIQFTWRDTVRRFDELRELLAKHGLDINPLGTYYLPPEPKPEPGELVISPGAEAEWAEADE
jgi:hypothetical protein